MEYSRQENHMHRMERVGNGMACLRNGGEFSWVNTHREEKKESLKGKPKRVARISKYKEF